MTIMMKDELCPRLELVHDIAQVTNNFD